MNHVSVSPTDGNGPTQGQRKTLTRVGIEPTTFGLDQYKLNCWHDRQGMNKDTLKNKFEIFFKPGHLDKLYKAIQKVQYPNECKFQLIKLHVYLLSQSSI